MTNLRLLAAIAAAGAAAIAVPAASQPYPPPPGAYANPGEQILQGVIDSLLGPRYNRTDRLAVRRCAHAALEEAWAGYGARRRGSDWGADRSRMRVAGITDVDRRAYGLRVSGEIDSGLLYAQPWQGGRDRRVGDLRFRCTVDYNGVISGLRIERNPNFRPY